LVGFHSGPPGFGRTHRAAPHILITLAFFCFFTNVNAFNLLPLYLQALGAQNGEIGTIMAMFSVVAILAQAILVRFLGGGLADRIDRQRVIVPALGAMTAGILLCSGLHATWLLLLIGVLNGTAQGFVMPAANALAVEPAPSGRRGQALAFYNGANLVGAMLGASGFGWLVQAFG